MSLLRNKKFDVGHVLMDTCKHTIKKTQRHDKMKTTTNIALEGTCNDDVVGGLYREPRENLQALLFGKGA
jgi:hypothetical protein